jgi:hypothetical protein
VGKGQSKTKARKCWFGLGIAIGALVKSVSGRYDTGFISRFRYEDRLIERLSRDKVCRSRDFRD